jgi:hypothetical protein
MSSSSIVISVRTSASYSPSFIVLCDQDFGVLALKVFVTLSSTLEASDIAIAG